MNVALLLLSLWVVTGANSYAQTPVIIWTSDGVYPANSETSVSYQSISFSDLWSSVVSAFVSSKEEEVALVPTPKKRPDVVVLFLSSENGPWQLYGESDVTQPLREAFETSSSRLVYNNVYIEGDKVLEVVKTSLGKQYDDITFLGGCQETSNDGSVASGLKTVLNTPISDSASPKVVVICAEGDLEEEMSQVKAADTSLKSSNVIYSMMYATEFDASFYQASYLNAAKRRRHLLEEEKIPIDYTTCDALCHTRVKFLEAIILSFILALALTTGLCCMHILDAPTQFEKPEEES